jgi:hypothetical protein
LHPLFPNASPSAIAVRKIAAAFGGRRRPRRHRAHSRRRRCAASRQLTRTQRPLLSCSHHRLCKVRVALGTTAVATVPSLSLLFPSCCLTRTDICTRSATLGPRSHCASLLWVALSRRRAMARRQWQPSDCEAERNRLIIPSLRKRGCCGPPRLTTGLLVLLELDFF